MKMNPEQIKLYKTIDDILWFDWDPIEVKNYGDNARDEYYSYLPQVYQLKVGGATEMEIAKYLDNVITERMGMESNMEFNKEIARKIVALKK